MNPNQHAHGTQRDGERFYSRRRATRDKHANGVPACNVPYVFTVYAETGVICGNAYACAGKGVYRLQWLRFIYLPIWQGLIRYNHMVTLMVTLMVTWLHFDCNRATTRARARMAGTVTMCKHGVTMGVNTVCLQLSLYAARLYTFCNQCKHAHTRARVGEPARRTVKDRFTVRGAPGRTCLRSVPVGDQRSGRSGPRPSRNPGRGDGWHISCQTRKNRFFPRKRTV